MTHPVPAKNKRAVARRCVYKGGGGFTRWAVRTSKFVVTGGVVFTLALCTEETPARLAGAREGIFLLHFMAERM